MARGLLAGSRERDGERRTVRARTDSFTDVLYGPADFDVVDAVREVAGERGVPPAQVALAWLLGRPAVTAPIVGAIQVRHLDDAVAAVDVRLDHPEIERLEAPYRPLEVRGHS